MNTINNYSSTKNYYAFTGCKPKLTKSIKDLYQIDMTKKVGYKRSPKLVDLPQNLPNEIRHFFKSLKIDWNTHVDKYSVLNKL